MKKSELKELIKSALLGEAGEKTAFVDEEVGTVSTNDPRKAEELAKKGVNVELTKENDEEDGIDTSMDKISKALSTVQKKLDQMFADFKMGEMSKDEYMSKRKELQAKRDKLNAALISFEEDEDEI